MYFGNNLKRLRLKAGLSQKELAGLVDCGQGTISKFEKMNGFGHRPDMTIVKRLAAYFNTNAERLLG